MFSFRPFAIALFAALLCGVCTADTIFLNNGVEINGTIVHQDDQTVVIRTNNGKTQSIRKADVDTIIREKPKVAKEEPPIPVPPTAPPAAKPVTIETIKLDPPKSEAPLKPDNTRPEKAKPDIIKSELSKLDNTKTDTVSIPAKEGAPSQPNNSA